VLTATLLLALAETQEIPQGKRQRLLVQALLAHQIGAQARQIAFREQRETLEQAARDHRIQNRIAKKLEAFVMRRTATAMGQRTHEQITIGERVTQCLLEASRVHGPRPDDEPRKSSSKLTLASSGTRR
jgi:hypothetical protein